MTALGVRLALNGVQQGLDAFASSVTRSKGTLFEHMHSAQLLAQRCLNRRSLWAGLATFPFRALIQNRLRDGAQDWLKSVLTPGEDG